RVRNHHNHIKQEAKPTKGLASWLYIEVIATPTVARPGSRLVINEEKLKIG
ncbi:hypothetical protein HMPREF1862_00038, partial [Varibaculum cambriense]